MQQDVFSQATAQPSPYQTQTPEFDEELRKKFLQVSKVLEKTWGRGALYQKPWYMIIGPSGVGKTTAIRESEAPSPVYDPITKKKQETKGVGGTRNCDWWFLNDAILLDTAGRWTEGLELPDQEQWLGFLRLLKKHRRRKPINGIIVAVSMPDFIQLNEKQIEEQAQTWRRRIDEIMEELKIVFPVYILFTKCDLLYGFIDTFGNMNKDERNQVWGHTISIKEQEEKLAEEIFNNGLNELLQTLHGHQFGRLQTEFSPKSKAAIYKLPGQFEYLQPKLSHFIEYLFRKDSFQKDKPIFRGFYFSSGTQEKSPIDAATDEIRERLGLPPELIPEPVTEKKSYFITDLITKIIIPDKNLAGSASGISRNRSLFKMAGMAAIGIALVLFFVLIIRSYQSNKKYIQNAQAAITEVRQINWQADTLESLKKLNHLLELYDKEPSKNLFLFNLKINKNLKNRMRDVCLKESKNLFLEPVKKRVNKLYRINDSDSLRAKWNFNYNTLKTYLMLSDSIHKYKDEKEKTFLSEYLDTLVQDYKIDYQSTIRKQRKFYLDNYVENPEYRIKSEPGVVDNIRNKLNREIDEVEIIYHGIIAKDKESDLTLANAFEGKYQNVLRGGATIKHIFSLDGWKNYAYKAIYKDPISKDDWVLGITGAADNDKNLRQQIADRYFRAYKHQWHVFLRNIEIERFSDSYSAKQKLKELSDIKESPISVVLEFIKKHTCLPINPSLAGQVEDVLSGKDLLPEIAQPFDPIHRLIGVESNPGPITQYLEHLKEIAAIIENMDQAGNPGEVAFNQTKSVLIGRTNEFHKTLIFANEHCGELLALEQLLKKPAQHTWEVIRSKAQNYLNEKWSMSVVTEFNNFAMDFPFNPRSQNDADNDEVNKFFEENGTYWAFLNNHLTDDVVQKTSNNIQSKIPDNQLGQGLNLTIDFMDNYAKVRKITRWLRKKDDEGFKFILKALIYDWDKNKKNPMVVGRTLIIDGNEWKYNVDDPKSEKEFKWPGTASGAKLLIRTDDEQFRPDEPEYYEENDGWAWIRLLRKGVWRGSNRIEWSFKKSEPSYRAIIPFEFVGQNPFYPNPLENFRISQAVCEYE